MKRTRKFDKIIVAFVVIGLLHMFAAPLSAHTIADAECFFDLPDPGPGNGSHVVPRDGIFDEDLEYFSWDLPATLSIGPHTLYFRLRDTYGNWGVTRRHDFQVYQANPYKAITAAEYFVDADPGVGLGILLLPTDSVFNQPFEMAFRDSIRASLPLGIHRVYVRFRDNQFHQYSSNGFNGWGPARYETLIIDPMVAIEENDVLPAAYSLSQGYPNPFNAQTTIEYALPRAANVRLQVIDITGRVVATVASGIYPAGYYRDTWDAKDKASGVYFVRLQAGEFKETRKIVLLK